MRKHVLLGWLLAPVLTLGSVVAQSDGRRIVVVDGVTLSEGDLGREYSEKRQQLNDEMRRLRRQEVELHLNSIVLEAEAERRGLSVSELLEAEVMSRVVPPSEDEVRLLWRENRERLGESFEAVSDRLRANLWLERERARADAYTSKLRDAARIEWRAEESTWIDGNAEDAHVLVRVGEREVSWAEIRERLKAIEYRWATACFRLEQEVALIKINDLLLQREALARQKTTRALLNEEVYSRLTPPTEDEVQRAYREAKPVGMSFEEARPRIKDALFQRRRFEAEAVFAASLREKAELVWSIEPPREPVFTIDSTGQPSFGPSEASVCVDAFLDLQQARSRQLLREVRELVSTDSDAKLVVRGLPDAASTASLDVATLLELAHERGKALDLLDTLAQDSGALDRARLLELASAVGLEAAPVEAAWKSDRPSAAVVTDLEEAARLWLGTGPALFVNGRPQSDLSHEAIAAALKKERSAAAFTCRMHPDVRSPEAGTCPKCSCTLQPVVAKPPARAEAPTRTTPLPDPVVLDQDGRRLHFYEDLVRGKRVIVNFVFTTCTTICPPLTATFRKIQLELGERIGKDVHLISVSVDPTTDVPARLKEYAERFEAGPGWTFVTGNKQEIDDILRSLGAFTEDKLDHTPMIVLRDDATGDTSRVYGLAPVATVLDSIEEAFPGITRKDRVGPNEVDQAARQYFPNVPLVNQDGEVVRFYDDVLRGRIVLINFMFTQCTGICPPMMVNLRKVQDALGDELSDRVQMISVTVDPENDSPEVLRSYAESFEVKPGWQFLTGAPDDVRQVLAKLGEVSDDREAHSALLLVGDGATGEWLKMLATGDAGEIADAVRRLATGDSHR